MDAWKNNLRKVTPYVPGEQPKRQNVIKLNTNENPYPPAPAVAEAMKDMEEGQFCALRKYPDPAAGDLVRAIADYKGLGEDQVFVGVGSDDVLAMSFLTFFNSDKPILFPDITYSFYDVWAELFRIPFRKVALDASFHICPEDYRCENGGIIFPNPNAPTGLLLPLSAVRNILDHNRDVIVIVDEAYIDFGGDSAMCLLEDYENLLVVQTFSKSRSMAGMRIGYALGSPVLIEALNNVKYSYNSYTMNLPSIVMGTASVREEAYFRETIEKIISTREWFKGELSCLGFDYLDSMANFVFASHETIPAREIYERARAEGIYVRFFDKPRIDNFLRITIGTREEMDRFLKFLSKLPDISK